MTSDMYTPTQPTPPLFGPPGQPGYPPTPPEQPRRGGRILAAALVVGMLGGGAAGFAGATLVDHDDSASNAATTQTSGGALAQAPSASSGRVGTTESAAAKVLPSVVKIYASSRVQSGSGSGIVLTADGQILTNNHVVELALNGGELAVSFNDGTTAKATILGRDPVTDLAVIKAEGVTGLTPATLGDSDKLAVGEQVVAVGSPYGLESTVTTGIVSALNRPVTTQGEQAGDPTTVFPGIQTDAAINPGNSGGPLINLAGQVVGIDSAIRTDTSSTSQQSGSIGLGFAIPINQSLPIIDQLRKGETPTHARIGVTVRDATDKLGLPDAAEVGQVDPGSAAARAGLVPGDMITKVDDHAISGSDSLVATVRSYRPGERVTLTVKTRSGQTKMVQITLGSDNN